MQVRLGAPFCREVEVPLKELERLIPLAEAAGVDTSSAQAVYDDLSGYLVYVPLVGDACEKHTAEAKGAVLRLQQAMNAVNVPAPEPLRPDYVDPKYVVTGGDVADPDKAVLPTWVLPTWVKFVAVAGVSAFLLAQVAPFLGLLPKRRLAGYSRRRRTRRKR